MSIDFNGPVSNYGNRGCIELNQEERNDRVKISKVVVTFRTAFIDNMGVVEYVRAENLGGYSN